MILVFFAATVLFGIEFVSLYELKKEANALRQQAPVLIEDTYRYNFVEADYERVEAAIIRFAEEVACNNMRAS